MLSPLTLHQTRWKRWWHLVSGLSILNWKPNFALCNQSAAVVYPGALRGSWKLTLLGLCERDCTGLETLWKHWNKDPWKNWKILEGRNKNADASFGNARSLLLLFTLLQLLPSSLPLTPDGHNEKIYNSLNFTASLPKCILPPIYNNASLASREDAALIPKTCCSPGHYHYIFRLSYSFPLINKNLVIINVCIE